MGLIESQLFAYLLFFVKIICEFKLSSLSLFTKIFIKNINLTDNHLMFDAIALHFVWRSWAKRLFLPRHIS